MIKHIYIVILEYILYESIYIAINTIYKVFYPPLIIHQYMDYTGHILNYWIEISDITANIIHLLLILAIDISYTIIPTIIILFAIFTYLAINYIHDMIMIAISNIVMNNYIRNQNIILIYIAYRQPKSATNSCTICYSDADEIKNDYIIKFKCGHEYCYNCVLLCEYIHIRLRCPACTQLIL